MKKFATVVAVAMVGMMVACCVSAGEVTKTVTVTSQCGAVCVVGCPIARAVIAAPVVAVRAVGAAARNAHERVCERRACRQAKRCVCVQACEAKAPEVKVEIKVEAPCVVRQRTVTRTRSVGCGVGGCR